MEELEIIDKQRRNRERSLANLHPIKKGQSGNPKGRPKKVISLTSEMKTQLEEVCPYDPKGRTWLQYLVDRWLARASDNATYFKELIERLEGKVVQPIGGEDGKPIPVVITTIEIVKDYGNGNRN